MQKKKMIWTLIGIVVLAALGGGLYAWRANAPASEGQASKSGGPGGPGGPGGRRGGGAMPVATATVRAGDMDIVVAAIGTVSARNTATVRARVDGLLQRVTFREGQKIKAGDVLAEIDPRAFKAALDQAEGQLARDQAQLTNAVIDQQRYQALLAKDSISRQQLDTQDALVRQLQGTVQNSRAAADSARLQLSFTHVTAPIGGRLGLRQVDVGNMVRAADTNGIVVITETQPINVVFAIAADQLTPVLQRVQSGATLPVEAFDREGRKKLAVGRLASVDNQVDTTTGTVKLKAEFENRDDALFPNQFVNVRMKVDTRKNAVLIPPAAVQRGTQGSYVYVLNAEDKTVSLRPVTPGPTTADTLAIDKGLTPGEIVVTDGLDKLRPGAKVEPIQPGGMPGGAPAEGRGRGEAKEGGKPPAAPEAARSEPPKGEGAAPKSEGVRPEPARAAAPAEVVKPVAPPAAASAPQSAPAAASAASPSQAAGGEGERPRWMDRVPPEVAEKLKAMTPEERRAWFQKRREERERQAAAD